MRQMRLEKREIKDPAELEKVLDACKVVRIGTMDAEGMFVRLVVVQTLMWDKSCIRTKIDG